MTVYMIDRGYSTEELAAHTGLPAPTVKYLVKHGVLRPSVQQAKGRGHANVFSFRDVLAAQSLSCLQFDNALAKPLRKVVQFWASPEGEKLLRELKGRPKDDHEPRVLLVTDKGVKVDAPPSQLMKDDQTSTVYCLDARRLYRDVMVRATEAYMTGAFSPPGPSGRAPRRRDLVQPVVKAVRPERHAKTERPSRRANQGRSRGKK